jgi:5'-nucleotidase
LYRIIKTTIMKDIKPRCFVDMDGVLCDFFGAFSDVRRKDPNFKYPQSRIGFFKNLEPMPDAIESFNKLKEHYDVWILTRPSFKNISCFNEKAEWVLEHLGFDVLEKTIMCGDKSLLKGDILIDDDDKAGQPDFEGEWIEFASDKFPDWTSVIDYLIKD